jgi:hypothetical protein
MEMDLTDPAQQLFQHQAQAVERLGARVAMEQLPPMVLQQPLPILARAVVVEQMIKQIQMPKLEEQAQQVLLL